MVLFITSRQTARACVKKISWDLNISYVPRTSILADRGRTVYIPGNKLRWTLLFSRARKPHLSAPHFESRHERFLRNILIFIKKKYRRTNQGWYREISAFRTRLCMVIVSKFSILTKIYKLLYGIANGFASLRGCNARLRVIPFFASRLHPESNSIPLQSLGRARTVSPRIHMLGSCATAVPYWPRYGLGRSSYVISEFLRMT